MKELSQFCIFLFNILFVSTQSFSNEDHKLTKLRENLRHFRGLLDAYNVDVYLVLTVDAHNSEFNAACDHRLAFISGFTGSEGSAIITQKMALLWTDGRYHTQARRQINDDWILMAEGFPEVPTEENWLITHLLHNETIAYDPWLITYQKWMMLNEKIEGTSLRLLPLLSNPVDQIWGRTKPPCLHNDIIVIPNSFTGRTWLEKVTLVREKMAAHQTDSLIITALDEVAWLFNLRGSDIPYNPVFYSYAIITMKQIHLFLKLDKLDKDPNLKLHLFQVEVHPYEDILKVIQTLSLSNSNTSPKKIWLNNHSSFAIVSNVPTVNRVISQSPIAQLKAIKTNEEIDGSYRAHIQDAVALCEYLSWIEEQLTSNETHANLTEYTAAQVLERMRSEMENYVSLSFATISAQGPNSAVIHYQPEKASLNLTVDQIYLVDSGGQYSTGTTDVTRTLHFGTPRDEERLAFTLVLKGHVQLAMTEFPMGTRGSQLDAIARSPLWRYGMEYLHGTGHGVGAFLNVHEGPYSFTDPGDRSEMGLMPNMLITIEPGYYSPNKFGIRIENVYAITPVSLDQTYTKYSKRKSRDNFIENGKQFLRFETMTLIPIQQKMIVIEMLTPEEIEWIDFYHLLCQERVGLELQRRGRLRAYNWLLSQTTPLRI